MKNLFSGDMIKQVKQMQDQLKKTQKELEKETVTGSAAGGMVEVVITGNQKCLEVKLQQEKMKDIPVDRLESFIQQAINDAFKKSKKLMAKKLGPLGGGLAGLK